MWHLLSTNKDTRNSGRDTPIPRPEFPLVTCNKEEYRENIQERCYKQVAIPFFFDKSKPVD